MSAPWSHFRARRSADRDPLRQGAHRRRDQGGGESQRRRRAPGPARPVDKEDRQGSPPRAFSRSAGTRHRQRTGGHYLLTQNATLIKQLSANVDKTLSLFLKLQASDADTL